MSGDLDLFRAWRGGDRQAGSALFARHFDAIYRFFRNKLDGDIEELVQRTFVACIEGRDRFREEASFRTYLFAIAQNLLREHFRRRRRTDAQVDLDAVSVVDLGASPISVAVAKQEEKLLVQALRRIPVNSQIILELYFWEHLTGAELGAVLGVVEDTARSRLRRAKLQLEAMLRSLEAQPTALESTLCNLERWAAGIRAQFAPAG